ncbi:MAG TPA: hypothetical protein VGJ41_08295 [Nocardioides sp.]|jgi:predicted lipoprotein with Yx(FWY)xxD motif
MFSTRLAALGFSAVVAVGLAGCGNNSNDGGPGPDSSTIKISDTSLGPVLTDGAGMTLYLYTPDSGGKSVCEAACLAAWPALEGKPAAGDGVDAALIGTITRDDGATQATYSGHPLYYYADDSSAGDVNGQQTGGVWYAVSASGSAVQGAPPADTGGGY